MTFDPPVTQLIARVRVIKLAGYCMPFIKRVSVKTVCMRASTESGLVGSRSYLVFLNHHPISIMELGHLLTRSGLTYSEVSSKVCRNSFCQLGNSVSLPWVIYYEVFY